MLSYQHAYHAGNIADLQKHAALAWALEYLTRKDKPLSYVETHAGRGLYDLEGAEARKTGEAAAGIGSLEGVLPEDHPLRGVLAEVRAAHGPAAYPGSPLIAETLLRDSDRMHLAELHPAEHAALSQVMVRADIHRRDGFELAQSILPPTPRRGLLLCDPSYEVKRDYELVPKQFQQFAAKWNVGVLMLWYPILTDAPHKPMLRALERAFPDALRTEIAFPPVREGHRMVGSGMFVVNPPFGLEGAMAALSRGLRAALIRTGPKGR